MTIGLCSSAVELRSRKVWVAGSNPAGGSKLAHNGPQKTAWKGGLCAGSSRLVTDWRKNQ